MEFRHVPVLFNETMEALKVTPGGTYIDGTTGGGGHSSGICQRLEGKGLLVAVDRDMDALRASEKRLELYSCSKKFVHTNYSDIETLKNQCGPRGADGILLDLGVSSFQLDNPDRGFSYMHDAPLDMRMDEDDSLTAYDVVNKYDQKELERIIREYGEERWASRIAQFIVRSRDNSPLMSTGELVDVIKAAIPARARREGPHPAKRTFQAIRIEVNGELDHVRKAAESLPDILAPGGRLAIITFHSLEDRIVKQAFNKRLNPCTCPKNIPVCVCGKVPDVKKVTGKPVVPGKEELEANPRARSAKLRVIEKLDAASREE